MTNTGNRLGRQLVQVYLSRAESAVDRPVRWLAGPTWVEAEAGGDHERRGRSSAHALSSTGPTAAGPGEPGAFVLEAGRSVADLRLTSSWS